MAECPHGETIADICPACNGPVREQPDLPIVFCRSCRAPIVWTITRNGKQMPVDAEPVESGNVELRLEDGELHAVVHGVTQAAAERRGRELHTSHFATCPHSRAHRRR